MDMVRGCWDASSSISELLLFACASLHQLQNMDPCREEPYRLAKHDRAEFRRRVRAMAMAAQAEPRLPPTPVELDLSAQLGLANFEFLGKATN